MVRLIRRILGNRERNKFLKEEDKSGIKVGDTVRVMYVPTEERIKETHWKNAWNPRMDKYVGRLGVVKYKSDLGSGFSIAFDDVCDEDEFPYFFPYFVLAIYPAGSSIKRVCRVVNNNEQRIKELLKKGYRFKLPIELRLNYLFSSSLHKLTEEEMIGLASPSDTSIIMYKEIVVDRRGEPLDKEYYK